jgi:DNA-directed RNA polymerase I subunit RPA2
MERDALIAHGVAFCLNDRLLKCSDYSEGYVCNTCGGLISAYLKQDTLQGESLESMLNQRYPISKMH